MTGPIPSVPIPSVLSCLSVTAAHASLDVLERLSYPRGELAGRLTALRASSGASAVAVLSTCQRTEVYASWPYSINQDALLTALARDRGLPPAVLRPLVRGYAGEAAARHLLRVASGLESFVLGETEIAGQVRAAASISQSAGRGDAVLGRLMDAAIRASRKRHRETSLTAATRSVASVAVDAVTRAGGGSIAGQRLLVVGAGQVAAIVVARAAAQQAAVTVCNRTRRHADRLAAAGAAVADLGDLAACLAASDIAVLATGAPEPLVTAGLLRSVRSARPGGARPLTLVDLSMPRNVDPAVRALPGVRLIDLADLRSAGLAGAGGLVHDLAAAEEIIEDELQRYLRWLAGAPGRHGGAADARRRRGGRPPGAGPGCGRTAGRGPSRRGAAAAADRAPSRAPAHAGTARRGRGRRRRPGPHAGQPVRRGPAGRWPPGGDGPPGEGGPSWR